MNNKFFKMFAAVCLILVFFHTPIFSIGGAIKGNVKEKGTSKPIEKVKITIVVLKSSSLQYELFTDEKGNYLTSIYVDGITSQAVALFNLDVVDRSFLDMVVKIDTKYKQLYINEEGKAKINLFSGLILPESLRSS